MSAEETVTLLAPSSSLNKPPLELELTSSFAQELLALQEFSDVTHDNGRATSHPIRVCRLLSDFTGGQLAPEMYSAALLHDIGQAATSQEKTLYVRNGTKALKKAYIGRENTRQWTYVAAILGDLDTVEEYSKSHRQANFAKSELLSTAIAENGGPKAKIASQLWLEPSSITRPTQMLELLDRVNIESVLLKSAEMLDNLMHPSANEHAILRDVHDAESFYAPICEIMGKDGLASALRSWANVTRLQRSGNGVYVAMAQSMIDRLSRGQNIPAVLHMLLGELAIGEDYDTDYAIGDTTGHGIRLGIAEIELQDGKAARAVWRLKSVGSLAMKLMRLNHETVADVGDQEQAFEPITPSDILGINVISPDAETLANVFARAAINARESEDVNLIASPSRVETLHIKGEPAFANLVAGALLTSEANISESGEPKFGIHSIDKVDKSKDGEKIRFAVAKMTCEILGVKTEVQFQTEVDRIASRVGLAAHLIYEIQEKIQKQTNRPQEVTITPEDIAAMKEINARMKKLSADFEVLPITERRGDALKNQVARFKLEHIWDTIRRHRR